MAGADDNKPTENESVSNDMEVNDEENVREEYDVLDNKLDELNQALDMLEQKNDDIHKRLKELLQSNREIRQQLQNENTEIGQLQTESWPQCYTFCKNVSVVEEFIILILCEIVLKAGGEHEPRRYPVRKAAADCRQSPLAWPSPRAVSRSKILL